MKNSDKENRTQEQNSNPKHTSQKQVGQNMSGEYDVEHTIFDGPKNDPESVKNSGNQGSYDKNSKSTQQAQQNSVGTKQAGAETKSKNNENGYGNHKQEPEANENLEVANDDPLTNGHVVSNQDEKDLKKEVDNDGTTTEGR
jgi:hypothetical protein